LLILTKSGSKYDIDPNGICRKYDSRGEMIDAFKVFYMRPVPLGVGSMDEIFKLPEAGPEIGKYLYIAGRDSWWLSTEVVGIEEEPAKPFPSDRFRDKANGE